MAKFIVKGGSYIKVDDTTDEMSKVLAGTYSTNRMYFAGGTVYDTEAEAKKATQDFEASKTRTASSSNTTSSDVDGTSLTRAQAFKLIPWLQRYAGADANKLVDSYVKGYIDSDVDTTVALAEMRFGESKEAYTRVFKNIVDEDTGALKMTESEYISGLESTLTTLTEYSLGGYASAKGKEVWASLVKNNVSPQIYRTRVGTAFSLINQVDEELKANIVNQYNEYFSTETGTTVNMTDDSILALAIDPNINNDILSGRLNASELGAIYTGTVGDKLDLQTVERYIGAGLQASEAERTFATASTTARVLGRMSRRFKRDTSLGKAANVLEAQLFGDELISGQIKSITAQVLSESSIQTGAAKSQTGGVIGLTEV